MILYRTVVGIQIGKGVEAADGRYRADRRGASFTTR
jgi:hypothetical protein